MFRQVSHLSRELSLVCLGGERDSLLSESQQSYPLSLTLRFWGLVAPSSLSWQNRCGAQIGGRSSLPDFTSSASFPAASFCNVCITTVHFDELLQGVHSPPASERGVLRTLWGLEWVHCRMHSHLQLSRARKLYLAPVTQKVTYKSVRRYY